MMEWIGKYGDAFWSKDVNTFRGKDAISEMDETIGCSNCHDPATMELRPYSEPLKDWLKRSGKDWNKLSRNEKRSLVCAQCHVEYYFTHKDNGPAGRPVFPWDKGFGPGDMYEYYKSHGPKQADGSSAPFTDWVHAASKVPMIKMQHPEYETFIDGPHGAAGVSCADCHMPYQRVDGKKVSSHWMTSPLKDPELRACRQCHADKTADYLRGRVLYTQEKTFRQLLKAQEESVRAHEAVRLANAGLLCHQCARSQVCRTRHAGSEPADAGSRSAGNAGCSPGWFCVACRRYGLYLLPHPLDGRPDGLLVSLCDHV